MYGIDRIVAAAPALPRLELDPVDVNLTLDRDPVLKMSLSMLSEPTASDEERAAAARLWKAINASPEPFSNIAMSLVEDGLVVGAIWLATNHPVAFGVLLLITVVLMWIVTWMLFKFLRAVFRRAQRFFSGPVKEA